MYFIGRDVAVGEQPGAWAATVERDVQDSKLRTRKTECDDGIGYQSRGWTGVLCCLL